MTQSTRRITVMAMILILAAGLAWFFLAGIGTPQVGAQNGTVGEGVQEALDDVGTPNPSVMIALAEVLEGEIQVTAVVQNDLLQLMADVAALQQLVLQDLASTGFELTNRYLAVPALAGVIDAGALAVLASHPNVVAIDLNVGGSADLEDSVPLINAHLWHADGVTGNGVLVAVIDSGLDTDHDDLGDDLVHEECFGDNNNAIDGAGFCPNASDRQSGAGAAEDDQSHGTHVTGIITSKGTKSSVGVAPDAEIVAIKVLDSLNNFYAYSEIVAALDFVIANLPAAGENLDVEIINMSLGTGAQFAGDCDNATAYNMAGAAAVNTLRNLGVTTFASSGNNSSGTQMGSPACLSNVISVGATDDNDNVAGFTNSNASTDIMAPGVSIVSTGLANGIATKSGTSMASPHAAGCAALLIESGEATTPAAIEARLETSPFQVTDATNGLTFPRIECRLKADKAVLDILLDDGSGFNEQNPDQSTPGSPLEQEGPDKWFLRVPVSDNLVISVTSVESNLGPEDADSDVTFLASIDDGHTPAHVEGAFIPNPGDVLSCGEQIDINNPLDQGPVVPCGTTAKILGDGNPATIESDLHFSAFEIAGTTTEFLRFFKLHCLESGHHTITFYNKVELKPDSLLGDPDLTNNYKRAVLDLQCFERVGGSTSFFDGNSDSSFGSIALFAGGIAAIVAVTTVGGWYTRRRWLSR